MNPEGPRAEDLPDELKKKVLRDIVERVAKRPVKVRMPYYFNKKGGVKGQ